MRCHFRRQFEGLGGLEGRVVTAPGRRLRGTDEPGLPRSPPAPLSLTAARRAALSDSILNALKEAEANRHTLTAGFLALQRQRHALKNTVLYWGDALPSSIVVGDEEEGNGGGGGGEERRVEEEAALLASHLEGRGRGA